MPADYIAPAEVRRLLPPGVCFALWNAGDLARVVTGDVATLLRRTRPEAAAGVDGAGRVVAMLHGGPVRLDKADDVVVPRLRALHPGLRVWYGVGCDAWCDDVLDGRATVAAAVDAIAGAADDAVAHGAETVVLDAEAPYKTKPPAMERSAAIGHRIARGVIASIRAKHPGLPIGFTSYDHPGLHRAFPWEAFCGAHGVDYVVWQWYGAPAEREDGTRPTADPRALARRLFSHRASVSDAVREGLVRADMVHMPYLQAHHVPLVQTATAALDPGALLRPGEAARLGPHGVGAHGPGPANGVACLWSWPKRADAHGYAAAELVARVWQRAGGDAREAQRRAGATPDGLLGPDSYRKITGRAPPT